MVISSDFTPLSGLVGGVLVGAAASLFLFSHGRVAGISGLLGGVLLGGDDRKTAAAFLAGLVVTGLAIGLFAPGAFDRVAVVGLPAALTAGVVVGFGTRLGGGCTSGHGVCGTSRMSKRSIVATLVFMATGFASVFVIRHLLFGGG